MVVLVLQPEGREEPGHMVISVWPGRVVRVELRSPGDLLPVSGGRQNGVWQPVYPRPVGPSLERAGNPASQIHLSEP